MAVLSISQFNRWLELLGKASKVYGACFVSGGILNSSKLAQTERQHDENPRIR